MKDKPRFFSSLSEGVIFSVNNELSLRVTHLSADESFFPVKYLVGFFSSLSEGVIFSVSNAVKRTGGTLHEKHSRKNAHVPRMTAVFLAPLKSRLS